MIQGIRGLALKLSTEKMKIVSGQENSLNRLDYIK